MMVTLGPGHPLNSTSQNPPPARGCLETCKASVALSTGSIDPTVPLGTTIVSARRRLCRVTVLKAPSDARR